MILKGENAASEMKGETCILLNKFFYYRQGLKNHTLNMSHSRNLNL